MDNANLTAALALAAAGVKIFPAGTDKRPLFKQWQEIATTECEIISEWWRRAPYALPAIPCGANGLLVIDLDRHGNGSDGVSAFEALAARHGVCISTSVSRRASRSAMAAAVFLPAATCEASAAL